MLLFYSNFEYGRRLRLLYLDHGLGAQGARHVAARHHHSTSTGIGRETDGAGARVAKSERGAGNELLYTMFHRVGNGSLIFGLPY